jgi:hypothetical protein
MNQKIVFSPIHSKTHHESDPTHFYFKLVFRVTSGRRKDKGYSKKGKTNSRPCRPIQQGARNEGWRTSEKILVEDIDQLVSSGTWRRGFDVALAGMMRSSNSRPGSRTLTIEHIRFLDNKNVIADARYEVTNEDGSKRKMWSTFIVKLEDKRWKIAAIRNMLPAQ